MSVEAMSVDKWRPKKSFHRPCLSRATASGEFLSLIYLTQFSTPAYVPPPNPCRYPCGLSWPPLPTPPDSQGWYSGLSVSHDVYYLSWSTRPWDKTTVSPQSSHPKSQSLIFLGLGWRPKHRRLTSLSVAEYAHPRACIRLNSWCNRMGKWGLKEGVLGLKNPLMNKLLSIIKGY